MDDYIAYTTYDLPIPYIKNGLENKENVEKLLIYPVSVKDYISFLSYVPCFTFDKNSIPDPNIIKMTNLEYIYHITKTQEDHVFVLLFDRLLNICLKDDKSFENIAESIKRYGYNEKKKPVFKIGNINYDSYDYDKLKRIICEQNLVDLPDENISKKVRDSLESAKEYKRRLSKEKSPSFEDYIVAISIATGWSLNDVYNMPARKFIKAILRMDNLIHYKIYLAASLSGMVEFKDKSFIKHWLTSLEEDKYKDVSIDYDEMQKKVSI